MAAAVPSAFLPGILESFPLSWSTCILIDVAPRSSWQDIQPGWLMQLDTWHSNLLENYTKTSKKLAKTDHTASALEFPFTFGITNNKNIRVQTMLLHK